MPTLCLNMIVRNEAARIERCLKSVAPYINHWVVYDTGSTDDTISRIESFFAGRGIPGHVARGEFINFEQARNAGLAAAREANVPSDYLLLLDADMELVVEKENPFENLTGISYDMTQKGGGVTYLNRRLLKVLCPNKYIGVTHEYLDAAATATIEGAWFLDHADGSNRADKYIRDVRLLIDDLKVNPTNGRSWFYLAQSFREMGRWASAMHAYQRRIDLGGWDEELWNSQFNIAWMHKNMGNEAEFIRNLLVAYNMRPSRAEVLFDLAHHFREKGWNAPASLFAEVGMQIPQPKDALFVNEFVYHAGLKEEFAITGFYNDRTKQRAFRVCDEMALLRGNYATQRHNGRVNLYHYLRPLGHLVGSFRPRRINVEVPDGYTAMNPSVASVGGQLCAIVRTVNYTMNENDQYLIKGTDGTANDSNPIHTRNFLCKFGYEWPMIGDTIKPHTAREIIYNNNYEVKYHLVRGWEDMRLIPWGPSSELFVSSCVREMNKEGVCEQVLAQINTNHSLSGITPMIRKEHGYEKNWMPIVDDPSVKGPQRFMYRLNHIVDGFGQDKKIFPSRQDTGQISGGSQVIPFFGGWIALVHEAMYKDGKRYYQHRFAYFNLDLSLRSLSLPFVFFDKQIEFAAGLCWHGPDDLVISFGVRDREAWMARIDATDVLELEPCPN